MTVGGYIKIAMLMSVACIAVIFLLVYRLLEIPAPPRSTVALQPVPAAGGAADSGTTPAASPTPTASSAITAEAKQYPNVHVSPGLSSRTVGVFNQGSQAEVVGRSADSVWLEIRYPQPQAPNGVGWVSTDLVSVSAPIANVPVVPSP